MNNAVAKVIEKHQIKVRSRPRNASKASRTNSNSIRNQPYRIARSEGVKAKGKVGRAMRITKHVIGRVLFLTNI